MILTDKKADGLFGNAPAVKRYADSARCSFAAGTGLFDLSRSNKAQNDTLILEPLTKFPVIEDLRVDRTVLFESLKKMEVWLDAETKAVPVRLFSDCYQSAKCLKCGLCLEVCPDYSGEEFAGPVAVAEGFLSLCQGADLYNGIKKGFLCGCSKSGACQKICPIEMETLRMIAKLSGKRYQMK